MPAKMVSGERLSALQLKSYFVLLPYVVVSLCQILDFTLLPT